MPARGLEAEVALRDVAAADLPRFFEHQRDPEASRMADFVPRDRAAFMRHWQQVVLADPSGANQTILVAGEVAGNVLAWDQDGKRLVGYWIDRAHWGRGVATAALREFLARCERTRPLHAFVALANLGSMRVLEKCGFVAVGSPEAGEQLMRLAD
ncbi:GNAT family N-acetyltransferase [Nannocystaceae bacterium ST9]